AELMAAVGRVVEKMFAERRKAFDALKRKLHAEVHQYALDQIAKAETITETFVKDFISDWSGSWDWSGGSYSATTESELMDLIDAVDNRLGDDADLKTAVADRIAELSGAA